MHLRSTLALAALLSLAGCEGGWLFDESGTLGDGGGGLGPDDDDDDDTPDPADTDEDGDGFTENEGDCDDGDADVHPDADEGDVADGVDDDCNGLADDQSVCEEDADYADLQDALNSAPEGFTLVVCEGTYEGPFTAPTHPLTVISAEGAEETELVGAGGRVLVVPPGADFTLQGFTLKDGTADNGGAATCLNAAFTLLDNILEDNVATGSGGAVYVENCELDFQRNHWEDNEAGVSGGGLYARTCTGAVDGDTFEENVASEGGGVSVSEGRLVLRNNSILSNVATMVQAGAWGPGSGGGGVWLRGAPEFLDNFVYDNDSGGNGGGVWTMLATGLFAGNTIEANECSSDGGGVYGMRPSNTFRNNVFLANEAMDDGGGLRIFIGRSTIEDNHFAGNEAGDDGGGVKMSHSSNTLRDNLFEENVAGDAGGGVELDNETADVSGCTFIGNVAGRGAGLHSWRNEGPFTIHDNEFAANEALDCGGAMAFDNDPHRVTLQDLWIENNTADDGAAVCLDEASLDDGSTLRSDVLLRNSVLVGNDAADDGGALYARRGTLTVRFTTMHGNEAGEGAVAAAKADGAIVVDSSIATGHAGGSVAWTEDDGTVSFAWSDLWDNEGGFDGAGSADPAAGTGNLSEDPDFVNAAQGDFGLLPPSPCVNAGNPNATDRDGSRADMGSTGGPFGS